MSKLSGKSAVGLILGLSCACLLPKDSTAKIWPIANTVTNSSAISGGYGDCRATSPSIPGCTDFHSGVDIQPSPSAGTTVYAVITGTAVYGFEVTGGYTVRLTGQEGEYFYAHLATFPVPASEYLSEGATVAHIGNTGTGTTGAHLHFTAKDFQTRYFPVPTPWPNPLVATLQNPLLQFSVQDSSNGVINTVLLRQHLGTAVSTITAGSAIGMSGFLDLVVQGHDLSNLAAKIGWFRFLVTVDGRQWQHFIFATWPPAPGWPSDINSVYSPSNPATAWVPTYLPWYQMGGRKLEDDTHEICFYGWDLSLAQERLNYENCFEFVSDTSKPALVLLDANGTPMVPNSSGVSATSMTQVSVQGSDPLAGIGKITLLKPDNTTSTQTFSGEFVAYATFSALAAGSYTAKVYDRAENFTSGDFSVDQSSPTSSISDSTGAALGTNMFNDRCLEMTATDSTSGICSTRLIGPSGQIGPTGTFVNSGLGPAVGALAGNFCELPAGNYNFCATNCAASENCQPFTVSTTALKMFISASSTLAWSGSHESSVSLGEVQNDPLYVRVKRESPIPPGGLGSCQQFVTTIAGAQADLQFCAVGEFPYYDATISSPARSVPFTIVNMTTSPLNSIITITASMQSFVQIQNSNPGLELGQSISGNITIPQVKGAAYDLPTASFSVRAPISDLQSNWNTQFSLAWLVAKIRQVLGLSSPGAIAVSGSEVIFNSTMTLTFQYQDGVNTDTTTARIYMLDGAQWSSAAVTNQSISKSTSGVITAMGWSVRTGTFAVFFEGQDSSPPMTAWSIQGSSSVFAGTSFVSTYSYLVLSSTDPTVNNFSSGLATTYYRIDGLPGDAYTAYSSSLSFLPGTHWVDFYAVDWAGNIEGVQRATITVTAGSVTRLSSDIQVDGNLLVGFLGSGAKAEVVARAEYDYALMVSSVDGRAMLAVDNANFASIGTAPASGRLTLAGVTQDAALALRSGNSTAAVTGAQLAFGFDGTSDLRHRLYTQHGSAANWNKMVFSLWTPASGSSTTLGNLPVLALEGSTITAANALAHVMPAGIADKELVVSNGSAMGEGTVLRWERWVPSAAILKKDIERLTQADEERAWADIAAMKPVVYRRKAYGPNSPFERGYVFEETPLSIRDGPGAASVDERLVNAELALKAAMRRIDELKARIKKVKEARR